ncbi:hypothetical protein DPMN_135475 [Dreissena polymorpha]|uniref:Heparan-sulfate 6-O-sulfotransferase n=2 Tax=Dreissena polymorpha TaxID=45954 RepID=A0A9D4JGW1_DREPO|nr:hypothetical protein DPMN_135475 [Dreissena polymorpha]
MNLRKFVFLLTGIVIFTVIVLVYICGDVSCSSKGHIQRKDPYVVSPIADSLNAYRVGRLPFNVFGAKDLGEVRHVKLDQEDVLVFLHMQKTGGTTFGHHLVKNLDIESPCQCYKNKKKCDCFTSKGTLWLFSRYSTGWLCGLHADWTELKSCVNEAMNRKEDQVRNRNYHYITILRDPVKRYLSEWKHVQRGATWKTSKLICKGHSAAGLEVPFCFNGSDWEGVTLDEFINCKSNLAKNRQTRMLADLTEVNCYNTSSMSSEERDQLMLKSAKKNLLRMAYFGLTEFQLRTQKLFEYTFDIKFKTPFTQLAITRSDLTNITLQQQERILAQNSLDIDLYQYAKDLFLQRVRKMRNEQGEYEEYNYSELTYSKDRFDDSVDIAEEEDDV